MIGKDKKTTFELKEPALYKHGTASLAAIGSQRVAGRTLSQR